MKKQLIAASILAVTLTPFAHAEDSSAIAFHAGEFDALHNDNSSAEFGIEYRFAPLESFYNIIPVVGFTANSDGGYWAHTGIRYDFDLGESWVITPHIAASLYENGGSKKLGYGLEFRSGIELAYKLNPSSHLGIGIYHLSNASLGNRNPGEESIYISYSFSPDILK